MDAGSCHIKGELRGGRGPAGACTADALRRWSGPGFALALQKDVTLNGQPRRLILLGAPLVNDQGTPVVTGVADYGDVRWLVVGPECAATGASILPPRNTGNEWPPQATVARLHGTDRDQIVISSGAGAHWSRINVFGYDAHYGAWRNEGEFDGDGGAAVGAAPLPAGPRGDLAWQAGREYDRAQLLHLQIFAWNPSTMLYALSETHIGFTFGAPATPAYPEEVVLLYYEAITAKDYRRAYAYFTPRMQQQQPFAQFQAGFATTTRVWVSDLQPSGAGPGAGPPADGAYPVTVQITSEDRAPVGPPIQRHFPGTWTVLIQNGVPLLDAAYFRPQ